MKDGPASAHRRALELVPEYRDAQAIGDARRTMRSIGGKENETRLAAWLFHQGFSVRQLAALFAVTAGTIESRLSTWRKLADAAEALPPPD